MSELRQNRPCTDNGDPKIADQLLPLVYEELRNLARRRLAQERPGQTLQTTALVHEAYLRLVAGGVEVHWDNRGHFFAAAAEAMRRILVDQARRKRAKKRGDGAHHLTIDDEMTIATPDGSTATDLQALDEALAKLEAIDPKRASVVKLRYFAGLTLPETAEAMEISVATAKRHWVFARSWLFGELRDSQKEPDNSTDLF